MKRWMIEEAGIIYTCSLLALSGSSKLAILRDDNGENIRFQFMKFFDFSRAKNGNKQTGWVKLPHSGNKVRAQINFK